MFIIDFLIMLQENARFYIKRDLPGILIEINQKPLLQDSASKILTPYLEIIERVEKDEKLILWIKKKFDEYKKNFPNNFFANYELNNLNGSVISQKNAEAIIVDFINFLSSCFILNMSFYI